MVYYLQPNCEHIPAGYVPVSLIEALNGPPQCIGRTLSGESGDATESEPVLGADLNKSTDKSGKSSPKPGSQKRSKGKSKEHAPEVFPYKTNINILISCINIYIIISFECRF